MNNRIWLHHQMILEAQKLRLPRLFTDDLYVHDRDYVMQGDLPDMFGHIIYDCGTVIVVPDSNMSEVRIKGLSTDPTAHYFMAVFNGEDWTLVKSNWQEMLSWYKEESSPKYK
jgi:hypothetical protein